MRSHDDYKSELEDHDVDSVRLWFSRVYVPDWRKLARARRCQTSDWSPSGHPMFEITTKAREELRELEAKVLQVPLSLVAKTLTST